MVGKSGNVADIAIGPFGPIMVALAHIIHHNLFQRFCDALYAMSEWIKTNKQAKRLVGVGRVEPFEGMVN
jgi:hypothetical protein